MIQSGVFAIDNMRKFFFSVSKLNTRPKSVSLLVRKGKDEMAVSVYRTRIDRVRSPKSSNSGIPANVVIKHLARLHLLRVLQVANDIVRGGWETDAYRPMLAVDVPWVAAARSDKNKRHVFALTLQEKLETFLQRTDRIDPPVLI